MLNLYHDRKMLQGGRPCSPLRPCMWQRGVATRRAQALIEQVKSFHSSRQSSLTLNQADFSSHALGIGSGSGSGRQVTVGPPIREESQEALTRASTAQQPTSDILAADEDDETRGEYLIRRQTLGELPAYRGPGANQGFTNQQTIVEQKDEAYPNGRDQSDSRATVKTEFSRQFEFVDNEAETGVPVDAASHPPQTVQMHSAWSVGELDKSPPTVSAAEQTDVLGQAVDDLTNDAINVTIYRLGWDVSVPLTRDAINAAQVVMLHILNRALNDDRQPAATGLAGSRCGPHQIQLALAIVRRLLDSGSGSNSKWTDNDLRAASLLVDDIMTSAVINATHGSDVVAKPDHPWSAAAIRNSSTIVRDAMASAAEQAAMDEQRAEQAVKREEQQSEPPTADSHKEHLVDVEHQLDVIEQPLSGLQLAAGSSTAEQPAATASALHPTADPQPEIETEGRYYDQSSFNDSSISHSGRNSPAESMI